MISKKNILTAAVLLVTALFLTDCAKKQTETITVKMLVGTASAQRAGKTIQLNSGSVLMQDDLVTAGKDSVLVVSFGEIADIEIQPDAELKIRNITSLDRELFLEKGNAWLRINRKLTNNEKFSLNTPTTIAAVRGTKFYSFSIGDIQGTCICQGNVDYKTSSGSFKAEKEDTLIMTRGDASVQITPEELAPICPSMKGHDHSMIENSPLGKKTGMTPEIMKKYKALVEKKLDAAAKAENMKK